MTFSCVHNPEDLKCIYIKVKPRHFSKRCNNVSSVLILRLELGVKLFGSVFVWERCSTAGSAEGKKTHFFFFFKKNVRIPLEILLRTKAGQKKFACPASSQRLIKFSWRRSEASTGLGSPKHFSPSC